MIPLRCDTTEKRLPAGTLLVVAACVSVFTVQVRHPALLRGFVPLDFTHSLFHPGSGTLASLATCAAAFFMHGGLLHLVSNMWYLWIFGSAVESRMGTLRFLLIYLTCGAVSMIVQAAFSPLSPVPIVGASGAIAGAMGVHFVLAPLSRVLVWVPILWFLPVFFFKVPAFVFLLVWFYVQYVGAAHEGGGSVAWWAHIGGFAAGIALGAHARLWGHVTDRPGRRKRRPK